MLVLLVFHEGRRQLALFQPGPHDLPGKEKKIHADGGPMQPQQHTAEKHDKMSGVKRMANIAENAACDQGAGFGHDGERPAQRDQSD